MKNSLSVEKKSILGKIVSVIDEATVKVSVIRFIKHRKYPKISKGHFVMLVHVPAELKDSVALKADVAIKSSRPISKNKSFILSAVY